MMASMTTPATVQTGTKKTTTIILNDGVHDYPCYCANGDEENDYHNTAMMASMTTPATVQTGTKKTTTIILQ